MVRYILSICLFFAPLLPSDAKGYLVGSRAEGDLVGSGSGGILGGFGSEGDLVGFVSGGDLVGSGSDGYLGGFGTDRDLLGLGSDIVLGGFGSEGDLVGFVSEGDLDGFVSEGDLVGFGSEGDLGGFGTEGDLVGFVSGGDLVGSGSEGYLAAFGAEGDLFGSSSDSVLGGFGTEGDLVGSGSERDSTAVVHNVSFGVRPALLTKHHGFYRGENAIGQPITATTSAHLQYSFYFPATSALGKLFPTSYQGIGLGFNTFFNHQIMGSPTSLYVFQGARIAQFGEKLSLDYEWNFGVSPFWKHNEVIGTNCNVYVNGGLLLSWYPIPEWKFSCGLDFTHFSNGDTKFPNLGVNSYGLRLTASRTFGGGVVQSPARPYHNKLTEKSFLKRTALDLIFCGAWVKDCVNYQGLLYNVDGNFGVLALHLNPLYQVTHYFSVGPSLDIQYNESANLANHVAGRHPTNHDLKFHRPPLSEQLAAGLSARLEFAAPIFSVNFGVGHNFIYNAEEWRGLYYILALKSFLHKGLFLHTGLRIPSNSSINLLLGLGYRF